MATYTVALPLTDVSPLIQNERAQAAGAVSVRYQVPYTVLQSAGTSASADIINLTFGTTPTTWQATGLLIDIPVAFAGSAAQSSLTATFGTTTTATAFASSFSLLTAGTYVSPNPGQVATPAAATGVASVTYQMVITCTCGFCSGLTTGFMTVLLGIFDPTATP